MRIIAGESRGRRLFSPPGLTTRPPLDSLRESLFSALEGSFEDRPVLDLFAGTGSFGLESVSRGARLAVFVESSSAALAVLRRNITATGFGARCEVVRGSAFRLPDVTDARTPRFALVFMDPPFECFESSERRRQIEHRIEEILHSPALEKGGRIVLRQPAESRLLPQVAGAASRIHGRSRVIFVQKAQAV